MSTTLGNKCGHVKQFPRQLFHGEHNRRYGTLEYAKSRLLHYFYHPCDYLKNLRYLNKIRNKRSERREAIVLIGQAILHYTDMDSLRAGINNPNGWWLPTLDWLSKAAGIGLKRTQRAIRDLARAGYIKITYRWTQRLGGKYINKAAARQIMPIFFRHLGISNEQLTLDQHRARKKKEIRPAIPTIPTILARKGYAGFKELKAKLFPVPKYKPPPGARFRPI